jgi:hypothetical protein
MTRYSCVIRPLRLFSCPAEAVLHLCMLAYGVVPEKKYIDRVHYLTLSLLLVARSSAVGGGTALQVGRSRFRFPMVSLEFYIDIILPASLWPEG